MPTKSGDSVVSLSLLTGVALYVFSMPNDCNNFRQQNRTNAAYLSLWPPTAVDSTSGTTVDERKRSSRLYHGCAATSPSEIVDAVSAIETAAAVDVVISSRTPVSVVDATRLVGSVNIALLWLVLLLLFGGTLNVDVECSFTADIAAKRVTRSFTKTNKWTSNNKRNLG